MRQLAPILLFAAMATSGLPAQAPTFPVVETTIADVHAAMRERRLTCRALVDAYLKRIEAYDRKGPALNAIVMVNPRALDEAAALDARLAETQFQIELFLNRQMKRSHCICLQEYY